MGLQFEFANRGELYMITQGSGGGYGDVLEREPELVAADYRDDLISIADRAATSTASLLDPDTGVVDSRGHRGCPRRRARPRGSSGASPTPSSCRSGRPKLPRGRAVTTDRGLTRRWCSVVPRMDTCPSDAIVAVMMPNPKDVRIAQAGSRARQASGLTRTALTMGALNDWVHEGRETLTWLDSDRYVWSVFAGAPERWYDDPVSMAAATAHAHAVLRSHVHSVSVTGPFSDQLVAADAATICAGLEQLQPRRLFADTLDALGHQLGADVDIVIKCGSPRKLLSSDQVALTTRRTCPPASWKSSAPSQTGQSEDLRSRAQPRGVPTRTKSLPGQAYCQPPSTTAGSPR